MKRTVFAAITAVFFLNITLNVLALEQVPSISANAAIVMHADSGEVLFEYNADEEMLIASTTKLMTALVVLENSNPDEKVEIKPEHTLTEGSSMYLEVGEIYSVEELLYGLMLASGNDAALALAYHVGGSVEGFARMMNETGERLGLIGSSFMNPHGLDENGHYSCARDLAVIMCAALEDELFAEIISAKSYTCHELTYYNHNKLLWSCEGVYGGKTGYTQSAGRSLVSCCERGGMKLVCVTLSDPDDWADHSALYDWAYDQYEYTNPLGAFVRISIPVISGTSERVTVAVSGDFNVLYNRDSEVHIETDMPRFVFAPVNAGETAGEISVYVDGELTATAQLCYCSGVELDKSLALTPWERFKRLWYMSVRYGYIMPY